MYRSLVLASTLSLVPVLAAAVPDQKVIDQMTAAANNGCLSGTDFGVGAKADGKISFANLKHPSADGTVSVDAHWGKGRCGYS